MMLPTAERGLFADKVHDLKRKELKKLVAANAVPLRPGVKQVWLRDGMGLRPQPACCDVMCCVGHLTYTRMPGPPNSKGGPPP